MLQLILYPSLYDVAVLQQESDRIQSGTALYSSSFMDVGLLKAVDFAKLLKPTRLYFPGT